MIPSRILRCWLLAALALSVGLRAPEVQADDTLPRCFIGVIDELFVMPPDDTARDANIEEQARLWRIDTTGLTADQLAAYSAYVCDHIAVGDAHSGLTDLTMYNLIYPSVDDWLQTVGQTRGQIEPTPDASGHPSKRGRNNSNAQNSVLYATDFDEQPGQLLYRDSYADPFDPELLTIGGKSIMRVQSRSRRSFYLTGANNWTDYAVEARVRVIDGTLMMVARGATDFCAGYHLYLRITADIPIAYVESSNAGCTETDLSASDLVTFAPGRWMTIRFEIEGDQISAYQDGRLFLMARDSTHTHGFPGLMLFPNEHKLATLDVDSLRVTALRAPPATLSNFAADAQTAVAELVELGQIPANGVFVPAQDHLSLSGDGYFDKLLGTDYPHTDVAMSATVQFTSGTNDFGEDCNLLLRAVSEDGPLVGTELRVGVSNNGIIHVIEDNDPKGDNHLYFSAVDRDDLLFEPGPAYHFLVTAVQSKLVVYVDGERALVINDLVPRSGSYGLELKGATGNTKCQYSQIWIYGYR